MASHSIDDERFRRLEKKAVDATITQKENIKTSDVLKYLIDKKLGEIDPKEIRKYKKGE